VFDCCSLKDNGVSGSQAEIGKAMLPPLEAEQARCGARIVVADQRLNKSRYRAVEDGVT
jgi:hypothetical protein